MYKVKHFKIQELVGKKTLDLLGEDLCWKLFDENLLRAIDWMRDKFGSATVNNWSAGGSFTESGLRVIGDIHYKKGSMHSSGCAVDLKFKNVSPADVQKELERMMKSGESIPFFTRLESTKFTPTWVHIDTKPVSNLKQGKIHIFNP